MLLLMKPILILLLVISSIATNAQGKRNAVLYNQLTIIKGTPYVVAAIKNRSKEVENHHQIMFVNTKTGTAKEFNISNDGYVGNIDQIEVGDKVIVIAQNLYGNSVKMTVAQSPLQIFIVANDKEPQKIVDDNFIISQWVFKEETGTIVVTGYYDVDNNGKYNLKDKGEIHVYDIKAMTTRAII